MAREVPIGERKPMRLNIVAEKYMRQFCESNVSDQDLCDV
jgi:hypothetical protein